MSFKPILIVAGEPNSIFLEILFKSYKHRISSPIILIASLNLLVLQMKKLNFQKKIRLINSKKLETIKLDNKSINLIDVPYTQKKAFEFKSNKSNQYIHDCFKIAFKILDKKITNKFINGPIYKKNFLENKYLGITEFLCKKFSTKKNAMLIYNENLSVCPVTTHLPLKLVSKKITRNLVKDKIKLINTFYKTNFFKLPKIAVLGLNPHCESIHKYNEDEKILKPLISNLKKNNIKIYGPFSADTFFLKQNRKKFNVILGMYHDQVLTPLKTLFEYDAINITMGLSFLRVSPDHGPNEKMINKKISNPISLIKSLEFLDKN